MRIDRVALASGVLAVALALSGCGGHGPPRNAVASVVGTPITRASFDHWLRVIAREQSPNDRTVVLPDPPAYSHCIRALSGRSGPRASKRPTSALKSKCAERYRSLKSDAMVFLVQSEWLLQEARSLGVTATPTEVEKELNAERGHTRQSRVAFARLVRASGLTAQDLMFGARLNVLTNLVREALQRKAQVTEADVKAAYVAHHSELGEPERRELLFVITKTRSAAERAKRDIENGSSWRATVRHYSPYPSYRTQLPVPGGAAARQGFERAIFSAKLNHLEGPVQGPFGYMVFNVVRVIPPFRPTLQQAHAQLVSMVRSEKQTAAVTQGLAAYEERYRHQTVCAAGFVVSRVCGNAARAS
jgi:foldase protein PrsA